MTTAVDFRDDEAGSTLLNMLSGNVSRPTPELHGDHIAAKFSSVFNSASVSPIARPVDSNGRLADQWSQGMRSLGRCIYCGRIEFAG